MGKLTDNVESPLKGRRDNFILLVNVFTPHLVKTLPHKPVRK